MLPPARHHHRRRTVPDGTFNSNSRVAHLSFVYGVPIANMKPPNFRDSTSKMVPTMTRPGTSSLWHSVFSLCVDTTIHGTRTDVGASGTSTQREYD
jgi:hypothetical protein